MRRPFASRYRIYQGRREGRRQGRRRLLDRGRRIHRRRRHNDPWPAAIEAAYAKAFAKRKKLKLELTVDSIRFPSKDTAIEEGYAKSYKGDSNQPTASRYSVLHVREGGRWLMAVLREWPDEGVSLRDLDWLIGTLGSEDRSR